MDSLTFGILKIEVTQEDHGNIMFFKGKSEERDPGPALKSYFKKMIEQIKGELKIDFTGFQFMNSAIVPSLLIFINELNKRKITTIILYRKDLKWQAATFKVLKATTKNLDYISVIGQ